jgi:hypothetical protein
MADSEATAGDGVDRGDVGAAVVGEYALDLDAVSREEGKCAAQEASRCCRAFVGEHLGVSESAVVIDGDVDVLPADQAASAAGAVVAAWPPFARQAAADAFTGTAFDAAELLDVDMHERSPGRERS